VQNFVLRQNCIFPHSLSGGDTIQIQFALVVVKLLLVPVNIGETDINRG